MYSKIKIGVGVTTRNRHEILTYFLTHLYDFTDMNKYDLCIVVNDDSDESKKQETEKAVSEFAFSFNDINYITMKERCGISKSKNNCLRHLMKDGCDYLFLFDDDTFPQEMGWIDLFIDTYKCSAHEHLMYLREVDIIKKIESSSRCVETYNNCLGLLLFFTRNAIEKIGGYNEQYGIYGYEHADISNRCNNAGIMGSKNAAYNTPIGVTKYIYSFDIDYNWFNKLPPIKLSAINDKVNSSIHGEDVQGYICESKKVYMSANERPFYVKLQNDNRHLNITKYDKGRCNNTI